MHDAHEAGGSTPSTPTDGRLGASCSGLRAWACSRGQQPSCARCQRSPKFAKDDHRSSRLILASALPGNYPPRSGGEPSRLGTCTSSRVLEGPTGHVDPGGVHGRRRTSTPRLDHRPDRRCRWLPPGHRVVVAEEGRPAAQAARTGRPRTHGLGALGRPGGEAPRGQPRAAGQFDRTDPPGRGLHRLVPDPGAPPPPGPRGTPSTPPGRERAHRDRSGGGVPVRLVRLLRLGGDLHCFGAVLCWSRSRHWWFAPSYDRAHTFEGLVRFFEAVGGVAAVGRTDRMGALGISRGRAYRFFPEALDFATYHGFALKACKARDAKRKGKTERPFGELNSAFMQEMALDPPGSIAELNTRARRWLDLYVDPRPHRVTKEAPRDRLAREVELLGPLPRARFDTA